MPGTYHRIGFPYSDGSGAVHIETTRPELLAACVALVAHPDDERYQQHFGTTVTTPVFGVEVPVVAHHLADPEKGSGIAMICTFGDTTDVTWWRELDLPTRPIVGWDGRIRPDTPDWITAEDGRAAYDSLAGLTMFSAKKRMVELLEEDGALEGEPRADHPPGQVLREGRSAPGDRHHAAVVHPQRRPRRRPARGAARPRSGGRLASPGHGRPVPELGVGTRR